MAMSDRRNQMREHDQSPLQKYAMGGDGDNDNDDNDSSNTQRRSFSSSSWTVASGAIDAAVTFESSSSPIEGDPAASSSAAANSNSPLLLRPPLSDPTPCEIKISFTQKHEVRQVYVRSSARLYEIYYEPDPKSCSDYLCTVRCGIVIDKRVMGHSNDIDEEVSHHLKGLDEQMNDNKPRNFSSSSSNEDDWVDVNVHGFPPLDSGNNSVQTKIDTNQARSVQVLYEATAEINDANPCISLTVRLLSLQDKESVCVDEIYVFADPSDSLTLESQGSTMESLATLMTMVVPSIRQLSKTTVSQLADKSLYMREKQNFQELGQKTNNSTVVADNTQHKLQLQQVDVVTAEPVESQTLPQAVDTEKKPSFIGKENHLPSSHLEKGMEQLISRVARIEDLCLRFEESMLRPISSIEARLQRVEQELKVLNKKSEYSEPFTCSRFSAPEFVCTSESNSFYNDAGEFPTCPAADKKEFPCDKLSCQPGDLPISSDSKTTELSTSPKSMPELAVPTHPLPSLVVTAPELSDDEGEEEENDTLEPVKDSLIAAPKQSGSIDGALTSAPELPNDEGGEEERDALEPVQDSPIAVPKQSRSIDDALTSALDGFLASVSRLPSKIKPSDALEFSGYDDNNNIALPSVQADVPTDSAKPFSRSDGVECQGKSTSQSIFLECGELFMGVLQETNGKEELGKEVDKQGYLSNKVDQKTGAEKKLLEAEDDVGSLDKNQINEEGRVGNIFDPDRTYIPPLCFLGDETDGYSHYAGEGSHGTIGLASESNITKDGLGDDTLHGVVNILDFSVELEMPSETLSSGREVRPVKSSFEALMTDMQEQATEAPDVMEREKNSASGMLRQVNLVEQLM